MIRNDCGLIWYTILAFAQRVWLKPQKMSIITCKVGVPADTETRRLANWREKRYRFSQFDTAERPGAVHCFSAVELWMHKERVPFSPFEQPLEQKELIANISRQY
jgi:hypothetical protein